MPKIHLSADFAAQFYNSFSREIPVDLNSFNGAAFDSVGDITISDILAEFERHMGLPFDHNCSITITQEGAAHDY